jgi:hypothetical protein
VIGGGAVGHGGGVCPSAASKLKSIIAIPSRYSTDRFLIFFMMLIEKAKKWNPLSEDCTSTKKKMKIVPSMKSIKIIFYIAQFFPPVLHAIPFRFTSPSSPLR